MNIRHPHKVSPTMLSRYPSSPRIKRQGAGGLLLMQFEVSMTNDLLCVGANDSPSAK